MSRYSRNSLKCIKLYLTVVEKSQNYEQNRTQHKIMNCVELHWVKYTNLLD